MDNAVWEGEPPSHTRYNSNNNAYEAAHGIHKACRCLSATGVACERQRATSEASFESDSDSNSESENTGSTRLSMACVRFEPERADNGKGPA